MRSFTLLVTFPLLLSLVAGILDAHQRKRKKKGEVEEITQTLEVPKDPPHAVPAEPQRLGFYTAPMSVKGLLSQQVRDGLKALRSQVHGASIIKIRALVAGTGDLRRVQAIVSEQFTEWRMPIPALTTIQVGALPQEGSQVLLEAITMEKKTIHPHGLVFLSGQQVTAKEALEKVEPLFKESLARLQTVLQGLNIAPADMLRTTCFVSALGDHAQLRAILAAQFPKAAHTIVQTLRGLTSGLVECEGVARASSAPASPLQPLNPKGLAASPNYSQAVAVNAPKIILSGSQQAFHTQDADVKLAFERLRRDLEQAGANLRNTVMTNYYPLTQTTIDKIRKVRFEFLDKARPPASTMLLFEGLPSKDASFAVEVITLP